MSEIKRYKFGDIVLPNGMIRGPFGSSLKKSIFVSKAVNTYKVYEQSVVLEQNKNAGKYYISKKYFENCLKRFEIKENDFLISCSGVNYGAIYQIKGNFEQGVINQALLIVRVNPLIVDYDYFLYYFRTFIVKAITTGTGDSTIPNFPSVSVIKDIEIMLPDIETQHKLGRVLSCIDNKIKLNDAVNDNLERQLMLLYNYWFTQFDFPDNNNNPYQTSGGKMVWNDTLKRYLPKGWEAQSLLSNRLSSVIKPGVDRFAVKTYLATADVKGTSIFAGTQIQYESRESRANMQPSVNSVWFAKMKNSIKHLYLNKEMLPIISNAIISTGFCGLQCKEKSFEYMASYISNSYFEIQKDKLAHGATQEAVNNGDLAGVYIVIPDDRVLEAYHRIAQPIYAQISKNICENREIIELRDWLLPMVMNGQVTISDGS